MQLQEMLKEHKDLQEYLFIRGFLLTDAQLDNLEDFPFYGNWKRVEIHPKYRAYIHKKTGFSYIEVDGRVFFLFGHAYNPFTMEISEEKILQKIAASYGTEGYQDSIDEITGVFVYGCISGDEIEFQVDPSGMQSAYYGEVKQHFYLTSHPQLAADLCDLKMSALAKELVDYKWYYRVMGPYLPGDMSPFEEIKRVVPSQDFKYSNGKTEHKRFWPIKPIEECKNKEEYKKVIIEAAKILKNNMVLVPQKWGNPHISLTGGIDSNTTFAAANGIYDKFKVFSYISAKKETIDADAAKRIADHFSVDYTQYHIPEREDQLRNCGEIKQIIDHNNGYVSKAYENELRKRVYLMEHLEADVEVKSWVSETIRAYWYKHYGRKSMPKLSPKLYRNLYKIFIMNRGLAHKIDRVFAKYIKDFEYEKIPSQYPAADMHFNEVTWGSWGGMNISEMKIYSDITFIYNNRKFLDILFRVPLKLRISDKHHLDMKKYLNRELYDMNIRVVNMKETNFRAFALNVIFTINSILPF